MSATYQLRPSDAVIGGAVGLLGLLEAVGSSYDLLSLLRMLLIAAGMGTAAGLYRVAPGVSLALVWVACGLQVLGGSRPMVVERPGRDGHPLWRQWIPAQGQHPCTAGRRDPHGARRQRGPRPDRPEHAPRG